jgi:hypothetical protein
VFFLILALSVSVSSLLAGYVEARRRVEPYGDWSFMRNRRALAVGGTVAVCAIAANLGGSTVDALLSVPAALLVGAFVALTANRIGPLKR